MLDLDNDGTGETRLTMSDFIKIEIEGEEKIIEACKKFPTQVKRYMEAAGKETWKRVIMPIEGLKKYPPLTAANRPPTPYYIRGSGTQYKSYNKGNSENIGKAWYCKARGYSTEIGTEGSYAHWVHGDDQAHFMAPKGWKKLRETAMEKIDDITKVYKAWIDKLLKDIGLS